MSDEHDDGETNAQHNAKPTTMMRTDDVVGLFGMKRRRVFLVALLAIFFTVSGVITIAVAVNRTAATAVANAELSSDEVAQLRSIVANRAKQRDEERDQIQKQLDTQKRALCGALEAFRPGAPADSLARVVAAEKSIGCAIP